MRYLAIVFIAFIGCTDLTAQTHDLWQMLESSNHTAKIQRFEASIRYELVLDSVSKFLQEFTIQKDSQLMAIQFSDRDIVMDTNLLLVVDHSEKSIRVSQPRQIGFTREKANRFDSSDKKNQIERIRTKNFRKKYKIKRNNSSKAHKELVIEYDSLSEVLSSVKKVLSNDSNSFVSYSLQNFSKSPNFSKQDFDTGEYVRWNGTSYVSRRKYKDYSVILLFKP